MPKTKLKICSKCKIEKDVKEFYADKHKIDGLYSSCKQCKIETVKKYYTKKRKEKGKEKIFIMIKELSEVLKQYLKN